MTVKADIGKQLRSTLFSSSGVKIAIAALAGIACIGIIVQSGVSVPDRASPATAFMAAGFSGGHGPLVRPAAAAERPLETSGHKAGDAAAQSVRIISMERQEQLPAMRRNSWALRAVEQPQAAPAAIPATASRETERQAETAARSEDAAVSAQRARASRAQQQRAARARAQEARHQALREAADARAEVRQEAGRDGPGWGRTPAHHSRMPIYDGYGRLVSPHAR